MLKHAITPLLLLCMLCPAITRAQVAHVLALPHREQLSHYGVQHVIQDSEGYLWYATDGGGLCRDDGRQVLVFRSDAKHPRLLGSNNVVCLAQSGHNIIIGTTHGANVLSKRDYAIKPLTHVGDKRVDDIIVTSDGHWWLTAGKKLYEYSPSGKLLTTIDAGDKYIFRMHQDEQGRLVCQQWEGGTLRLEGGRLVQIDSHWPDSVDFSRTWPAGAGCLLVSDGFGHCHAVGTHRQQAWHSGHVLTKAAADSLRLSLGLSARPTAIATANSGDVWFSTGKDIRRKRQGQGEQVISPTKDVSAMVFAPNGTLWLTTIFGHLYRYYNGRMVIDAYGSNEYGDGVAAMVADSAGCLVMLSDRYTRIYNPARRTMRQQSREADGTYMIELHETAPGCRWSQPANRSAAEHMPAWAWCTLAALMVLLLAMAAYVWALHRQRKRFMGQIKHHVAPAQASSTPDTGQPDDAPAPINEWLQRAMAQVEAHMADEAYTVEQLSSDMCMSRMTFYRKIQQATGHTPTEFMRTIRLRRAAELLRQGHMSVTEISYATGFASVSYFSRCFRAMFGVPPTQFCDATADKQGKV